MRCQQLLELTRANDVEDQRWWAVRALAASPHTRTEDLLPLLNNSAPQVRAAAALAHQLHPHEACNPCIDKSSWR